MRLPGGRKLVGCFEIKVTLELSARLPTFVAAAGFSLRSHRLESLCHQVFEKQIKAISASQ
jgi:hypothetical protein